LFFVYSITTLAHSDITVYKIIETYEEQADGPFKLERKHGFLFGGSYSIQREATGIVTIEVDIPNACYKVNYSLASDDVSERSIKKHCREFKGKEHFTLIKSQLE